MKNAYIKQPTKQCIDKKIKQVLHGTCTREAVCAWAMAYIMYDDCIQIDDVRAWHYLVAISNIDEQIAPNTYLF